MGISPQFADLNGDGHRDLISGCYEGVPYVAWGGARGFSAPQQLLDRDGNAMHTGRYWDAKTRKHTSGPGPGARAYSALPFDWDADGDFDLIIGTDRGGLYLRMNGGTKREPAFATACVAVRAGKGEAKVPGGYAMPVAADWDGDGLLDLVSGNQKGAVYWFRNTGTADTPAFAKPKRLVGRSGMKSWLGQKLGKKRSGPAERAQVWVADFDGDGDLDLLVGDNRNERVGGKYTWHGNVWLYRRVGSKKTVEPEPQSSRREI